MLGSVLFLTALPLALASPAQAQVSGYSCGTSNGNPATMARTSKGNEVAMIQFKSQHFSGSGWTPERRCQEVSQRFDNLHRQGLLRQAFLTTGRQKGEDIICVASQKGGSCMKNGILFTISDGKNPNETLRSLVNVARNQSGPLPETTSRPYYGLDEILATAESNLKPQITKPPSKFSPVTPSASSGESLIP
jgi:hypothetical protein